MKSKIHFRLATYGIIVIITTSLGLFSRSELTTKGTLFSTYGGDILWAALVYWGISFFVFKKRPLIPLTSAMIFSFGIEVSQLSTASWLMDLRATTLGALILGHGFLFSDLLCYTIGITCAFCIDKYFIRSTIENRSTVNEVKTKSSR